MPKLPVSNKTLSNIQSCLRSALNDAMDDEELIEADPLAGWTFSRKGQVKDDDVDPFSPDEQRAILPPSMVRRRTWCSSLCGRACAPASSWRWTGVMSTG